MEKDEMYDIIINKMDSLPKIEKYNMENRKICGTADYKQGIYFLYNKKNDIIYVGKVGTGTNTSLYHRIKGHGGGSHNKKAWYTEVEYGKFYKLEKLNESQIEILERISIKFNPNISDYNDKLITSDVLEEINSALK